MKVAAETWETKPPLRPDDWANGVGVEGWALQAETPLSLVEKLYLCGQGEGRSDLSVSRSCPLDRAKEVLDAPAFPQSPRAEGPVRCDWRFVSGFGRGELPVLRCEE